ncbi:MAG: helix-turn-helix domain-containing protein [Lachnospiraceae bacterium]|nr:helix-turn-helix domain-containing protein [Lachnospiraceae bacterium]
MNISNRIKQLRIKNEYTQKQLSDMVGLTPKMISFYENGERTPPIDILLKLVQIFDVSSDYILGLTDECISSEDAEWKSHPVSNRLGTILKKYREQNNLSIQAFSEELKIDKSIYIEIESGKYTKIRKLPAALMQQIANVTGYDIDYIIGATDHTSIPSNETIKIGETVYPICRIESNAHFKTRLEELCRINNVHSENVEEVLGITKTQFLEISWNRMPTLSELLKIAYSFGVSMDYLIGKTDIRMSSLDSDELELILEYRECSPTYKQSIKKRASDLCMDTIQQNEITSVAADEPLKKTGTEDMGK